MVRLHTLALALLFGVVAPVVPIAAHAGGGVGGSSGGTLPAIPAAARVNVDHTTIHGSNIDFLDYYPRSIAVHVGDTIDFHFVESNGNTFHTVTFMPAGVGLSQQAIAKLIPGGGGPVPDKDDPGRPSAFLSVNAVQSACGNTQYFPGTAPCNYNGMSVINSGVLFANSVAEQGKFFKTPPLHFAVTMNVHPGTYHYFCLVHGPGMSGTVTVVPPGAPATTPAQAAQSSATQFASQRAELAGLRARPFPTKQAVQAGHTTWTIGAGLPAGRTSRLETDEYTVKNLAIKAGDTVTWQPMGFHTVTFPAKAGHAPFVLQCENSSGPDRTFQGSLNGCTGMELTLVGGAFPSGPSGAAYHGGFWNSGILVVPQPHPWAVTFPAAGTYHYQCLVHYGMYGTITVS